MAKLPKDIHPDSLSRLPLLTREDMDEYGKQVWDKQFGTGTGSIAGVRGPGGIAMYSPKIAEAEKMRSRYLQLESQLSGAIRELAELVGQREMNAQYQWSLHEPEAMKEGLSRKAIDAVKYRRRVAGLPEPEAVVIQFGRELFRGPKVTSQTFARALKVFGPKKLVELVSLMGISAYIALRLRAFDLHMPPGRKPLLPIP